MHSVGSKRIIPRLHNTYYRLQIAAEKRYDKGEYWWELRTCDYYDEFEKPKIIYLDISIGGNFTLDENGGIYSANTTYILGSSDRYLLGILNSSLMSFFYGELTAIYRGGYLRFFTQYTSLLPIYVINLLDPVNRNQYDRMVSLVDAMLSLNKKRSEARISYEQTLLQRQIKAIDKQIDK